MQLILPKNRGLTTRRPSPSVDVTWQDHVADSLLFLRGRGEGRWKFVFPGSLGFYVRFRGGSLPL
jgi:hypothetical protein